MKKSWKLALLTMVMMTGLAPMQVMAADNSSAGNDGNTTTPIKHVVVIFGENVSFDHYFGTYPYAKNPAGEPQFTAKPNTPTVNGLTDALLNHNPNSANPQRLDRSEPITDDMDHDYTAEQKAFDGGLMDKFVQETGEGSWPIANQDPAKVMDYYDGNTVTGLWNYAQNFAMSDNSFGTTYGPSTPGALNLISGQTHGAIGYSAPVTSNGTKLQPDANGVIIKGALNTNNTLYSDVDPYFDKASNQSKPTVEMTGKNVGDLLNAKNVTWGWFEGGFRDNGSHTNVAGATVADYSPHHEPFQYYQSTSNPNHLPPTSVAMIGHQDQANHQYDISDFWAAADSGNMPAVSFLKAPMYQDGHAGYSDPLDEQQFIVDTINHLQKLPEWKDTAVILSYDDSDGWYDHVMGPVINGSNDPLADALVAPGNAGTPKLGAYLDRAGYGPRLPLMVISPYAKKNFVDHTLTDQTSILRFVEDNWNLGRIGDNSYDAVAGTLNNMFDFAHPSTDKLFLNPQTGEVDNSQNSQSKYGTTVSVFVNDQAMSTQNTGEAPFVNKNGNTMVPLVDFANAIGAKISYDAKTNTISLVSGTQTITLQAGQNTATVGGVKKALAEAVWQSPADHAYLPLRAVSELFGFAVGYENGVVRITTTSATATSTN